MSTTSSDGDDDNAYYDSYPILYDSSNAFSSVLLDATLRDLETSQDMMIPLLGPQNSIRNSNRAFPLLLLSSLYQERERERQEQDILNLAVEESMNSYHEEILRKNIKRRLSEDSYTIHKYNPENCRNDKCFVCLENFEMGSEICQLSPCNHVFHEHCLKEMIQYNPICALCKVKIDTYEKEDHG